VKLFGRQFDHCLLTAGPYEMVCLESLHQESEASPVIEQKLHAIALPVVERKDGSRKRVKPHRLLDQRHQGVQSRAEVDRFAMQVDPQIIVKAEINPLPTRGSSP
jgi:hypothetical protein